MALCFFSIRALRHGEGRKKPVYTDEDIARAKAAMDAMYLREHGGLPIETKPRKEV